MFPTWNFFLGLLPTPRVWVVPQTQSFLCSVDKSEQLKRRSREGCHSELFYFLGLSSQTFPSPNQASRTFHPQSRLPWQPLQLQTIPFSAREMDRWSGRMTWEQHSNSHRQDKSVGLLCCLLSPQVSLMLAFKGFEEQGEGSRPLQPPLLCHPPPPLHWGPRH